jgi:hypothetical protein
MVMQPIAVRIVIVMLVRVVRVVIGLVVVALRTCWLVGARGAAVEVEQIEDLSSMLVIMQGRQIRRLHEIKVSKHGRNFRVAQRARLFLARREGGSDPLPPLPAFRVEQIHTRS